MQLEADALVRGERSGPDPGRETIAGGRLHRNVMADTREIDVGVSIKNQAHGAFAGVSLLGIDADVHAGESFRKTPGKTAADNTRFESAVPQNRARRTLQISQARKKDGLVPDAAGFRDASFGHQGIDKDERIVQGKAGMKGSEPVPYFEGIPCVSLSCLVPDDIEVSLGNGWQDAIEVGFDVGSATEKAGERFRGALGVSFDGKAHFGESRLKFPLSQKEIAVTPRDLSGKRVDLFGVQKSVARSDKIGLRFISGGKIQPDFRRGGIQRQSRKVGVNGAASFGILEVVLPIAAQEIPIARVSGLQVDGPLMGFGGLQTCVVGGKRS